MMIWKKQETTIMELQAAIEKVGLNEILVKQK